MIDTGAINLASAGCNELKMLSYQISFLTIWMALGLSTFESVSAEECLTTPRQLFENKVGGQVEGVTSKRQPASVSDDKCGARE